MQRGPFHTCVHWPAFLFPSASWKQCVSESSNCASVLRFGIPRSSFHPVYQSSAHGVCLMNWENNISGTCKDGFCHWERVFVSLNSCMKSCGHVGLELHFAQLLSQTPEHLLLPQMPCVQSVPHLHGTKPVFLGTDTPHTISRHHHRK